MKRIFPLILTVLLLPSLLAVPARADGFYDSSIVNLLDYGFANNSNTNVITLSPDQPYVTFSYPNKASFNYIDVIFTSTASFSYVYFWNGTNGSSLTVYSLGSNLYRAFGTIPADSIQNYTLEFGGLSSNSTFNFFSVKVSNGMIANQDLLVNGKAWSGTKTCEFSSNTVGGFSGEAPDLDCEILLVPMEWKQYDFLTVYFEHEAYSISSISADLNYLPIPYEVDYLEASATNNEFRYSITLDLRGLDRSGEIYPNIRIQCRIANSDVTTFEIINAVGYVVVEAPSEAATWFSRLHTWITNLGYDIGAYFNTLAGNISSYISNQTTSIGFWFSQQLSAVNSWGKSINDSIGAWGWDIYNSISTWGQSLKDSIDALPDRIAEALQALIVPSDSAVQDFGESSQQIAQDRFGGVYEGAMIVDSFAGQLKAQAATQILTVPVVNLNILGTSFPLGGWEVDLIPEGSEVIIEAVKLMIDILATLAFINGIKSRLERTLEQ